MAAVNSTPTRRASRPKATPKAPRAGTPGKPGRVHTSAQACEAIPAYGVGDGGLSFRHSLRARERGTLDKALAIVGRALRSPQQELTTPDAVSCFLRLHLAAEKHEQFAVLFLDVQHRFIAFEIMFRGTLSQVSVYPREMVLVALRHGAAAVVLAHNHPSGNLKPSRADEALTQVLKAALALVDVQVLDHIIVGETDTLSLKLHGLM